MHPFTSLGALKAQDKHMQLGGSKMLDEQCP